jgi:hypothetical protein
MEARAKAVERMAIEADQQARAYRSPAEEIRNEIEGVIS